MTRQQVRRREVDGTDLDDISLHNVVVAPEESDSVGEEVGDARLRRRGRERGWRMNRTDAIRAEEVLEGELL